MGILAQAASFKAFYCPGSLLINNILDQIRIRKTDTKKRSKIWVQILKDTSFSHQSSSLIRLKCCRATYKSSVHNKPFVSHRFNLLWAVWHCKMVWIEFAKIPRLEGQIIFLGYIPIHARTSLKWNSEIISEIDWLD